MLISIRPYSPEDRASVHRIAADTAFFGDPVEAYLDDRRLFCDAFYAYYTDFEPQHGWVACEGEQVVGFLAGSTDATRQRQVFFTRILPILLRRLAKGEYYLGKRTWRYIAAVGKGFLGREFTHANLRQYPAHLHVNVASGWRGHGLGRRLIESYLDQLRELGLSGVHLSTSSENRAACALYEKMGFRLLDSRPTHLWNNFFSHPIENRCYGLKLSQVRG